MQHPGTALLNRIGAVLASSWVVVIKDEAGYECVKELVVLEHDLLVGVGDGDGGDAADGSRHT